MNGYKSKEAMATFALVLLSLLPSLTCANSPSDTPNSMFSSKLGCMTCHQGKSIPPEKTFLKKHPTPHHQKQ